MQTYIALLRGINVGGKHMVPMADLRALLANLGLEDPKTLLQSGNAVFRAKDRSPEQLEDFLAAEFEKQMGFRVDFFVRNLKELNEVIKQNPFPTEAREDPSHLLVIFLKNKPVLAALEAVQAAVKGPEVIRAHGRQLYITYPDGIGNSKLSATPGWSKLGSAGTARNWNTVLKLEALAARP